MYGSLLFSAVVGLFVLIIFVATWRLVGQRDPVEERLRKFGAGDRELTSSDALPGSVRRLPWSGTNRMLAASGLGPRLAFALAQADVPLTAAEFALIVVACFLAGTFFGAFRLGLGPGILIGVLVAWLPFLFVRNRQRRRQRAFTEQIPEVLTLLVGALRVGHGITQAMGIIVSQLTPPASIEFGRVIRTVALGQPLEDALVDMAARIGTDEASMIVMAITVQHESGGNLAQVLETAGDTIRDRLRVKREIRTLTSQQRLTGYILAGLPIVLVLVLSVLNPSYIRVLFAPGVMRIILVGALIMQVIGFLMISRIVDIEV
jgi:tight adherence protein B